MRDNFKDAKDRAQRHTKNSRQMPPPTLSNELEKQKSEQI